MSRTYEEKAALVDEVVRHMLDGLTVRKAVAAAGITLQSFHRLITSQHELSVRYAQAMQLRADAYADETVEIADTDPDPHRARNRITSRQWYAAKANPQRYGDRIELNVHQQIDIAGTLQSARARMLRPVSDQQEAIDAQVVDLPALSAPGATDAQSVAQVADAPGEPDIFS